MRKRSEGLHQNEIKECTGQFLVRVERDSSRGREGRGGRKIRNAALAARWSTRQSVRVEVRLVTTGATWCHQVEEGEGVGQAAAERRKGSSPGGGGYEGDLGCGRRHPCTLERERLLSNERS